MDRVTADAGAFLFDSERGQEGRGGAGGWTKGGLRVRHTKRDGGRHGPRRDREGAKGPLGASADKVTLGESGAVKNMAAVSVAPAAAGERGLARAGGMSN